MTEQNVWFKWRKLSWTTLCRIVSFAVLMSQSVTWLSRNYTVDIVDLAAGFFA